MFGAKLNLNLVKTQDKISSILIISPADLHSGEVFFFYLKCNHKNTSVFFLFLYRKDKIQITAAKKQRTPKLLNHNNETHKKGIWCFQSLFFVKQTPNYCFYYYKIHLLNQPDECNCTFRSTLVWFHLGSELSSNWKLSCLNSWHRESPLILLYHHRSDKSPSFLPPHLSICFFTLGNPPPQV